MADLSAFLTKLLALLRSEVGEDTYGSVIRQARAHAGGLAKAENAEAAKDQQTDESEARSPFLALFSEPAEFSDNPDAKTIKVQIFPHAGTYKHSSYGDLAITPEFLKQVKDNFDQKVYQQELPLTIDLEHMSQVSGAAGWIKDLDLRGEKGEDGLWATIEVNDRGSQLVREDAYRYFSPEYYDSWRDPASQVEYANVLIGGALTNRPFFKGMQPIYVANERTWQFSELEPASTATLTEPTTSTEAPPASDPPAKSEPEQEVEEQSKERQMADIDPKEFTELREKYQGLESALAEEKRLREQATTELANIRTENLRRELTEFVRGNRLAFKGEVPEVVDRLAKLREKFDPAEWEEYVEEKRATHKALAESELFAQKSVEGPAAVGGNFESLVAAKIAGGIARPDAVSAVARENPKLYSEHVRAMNRRAAIPE